MSRNRLGLAAALLSLAPALPAVAECLPTAARAAFRAQLITQLRRSSVPIEELYRHAYDRLGFGVAPHRVAALPPASGDAIAALADHLIGQLVAVDNIDRSADALLANITRTSSPDNVIDLSPHPYRHAATTMADAYTEIIGFSKRARDVQLELDALPDGDPRRPALEARFARLRRSAQLAKNEAQGAAAARAVAHAVLSANGDLGAQLTEFWWNHFNVDAEKVPWSAVDYRTALQRGACGRFDQLLITVAKHPAMAIYLDNFRSRADAINENYARELMELHTFGDDLFRFYQQQDVVNVARVLSGWSVAFDRPTPDRFEPVFRFYAGAHDGARIRLFDAAPAGQPLTLEAATGAAAVARGEQLLRYLADHAGTRRNICNKLSRRLIGDTPAAVVNGCMADAVWGVGGDLGAIYRFFLTRPELWQASSLDNANVPDHRYVAKDKNPLELFASAYRAVRLPNSALTQVWIRDSLERLQRLGLSPTRVPPPTGYKDGNVWLSSGLLLTWNQQLFGAVPTDALAYRAGSQTLRGPQLEAHFAARVVADPSAGALRTLGGVIARDVLQYPEIGPATDFVYPALVEADVNRSDRTVAPVRSYVHALLGHPNFLRK